MKPELIQPHATEVFSSLGGLTWFNGLPIGPARYEAVERMARNVAARARCSREEARKAVSKVIAEARGEKTR